MKQDRKYLHHEIYHRVLAVDKSGVVRNVELSVVACAWNPADLDEVFRTMWVRYQLGVTVLQLLGGLCDQLYSNKGKETWLDIGT